MTDATHNESAADRLVKRACRDAQRAEFFGAPPMAAKVARMARALSEGRHEEAMTERDHIRQAYSDAVGDILYVAVIVSLLVGVGLIGWLTR